MSTQQWFYPSLDAVYTNPKQADVYETANKCFYVNTFMKMLNQLFREHNLPEIKVGIGMSTAQELVVKAGRKLIRHLLCLAFGKLVIKRKEEGQQVLPPVSVLASI